MHVKEFIHKQLRSVMHFKRLTTLTVTVEAALMHKRLSLTNLGRSLNLQIQERSCIRKMDRFFR